MTISVWRYSHLALALSSFLFVALASVTGIILSFEAAQENSYPYHASNADELPLNKVIPGLMEKFPEITTLKLDERGYVSLKGFDAEGGKIDAFINPETGAILGTVGGQSDFYKWVTALHRSLFLKETGRFFIGLTAFLLLLITLSGAILVVKRQHGWKRFWTKITRDSFAQYYHVVTGRLALIPIFIIALSGTWLSLVRFGLIPETTTTQRVIVSATDDKTTRTPPAEFPLFKQTMLSEVNSIEFPFVNDDPEEYFILKLKTREVVLNQFDGSVLSETKTPASTIITALSLNLHTGRASIVWAIIIGIASINILFFIGSGFVITFRRTRNRIRNRYKADEAHYVLLTGSENGSTLYFAGSIHKQLLAQKKKTYLGELNDYKKFPKAEHLIIFTSTYGLGDAPGNAGRFLKALQTTTQEQKIKTSVLGFGSHSYPDFCAFAAETDQMLRTQNWAEPMLDLHTVNDKSPEDFTVWVKHWSEKSGILLTTTSVSYNPSPSTLHKLKLIEKTNVSEDGQSFMLRFRAPRGARFTSGDLLAVYPAGDHRERFYSIGKIGGDIQLVVKYHAGGAGSEYLHRLSEGSVIKAGIKPNRAFHFPRKKSPVIMIANGTGIAPFLGMLEQNQQQVETHLYAGFRKETKMTLLYREFAGTQIRAGRLKNFHIAFSREGNFCYVMELIKRDALSFAQQLEKGAMVMICGSLTMQQDVEAVINVITLSHNHKDIEYYRANGQIVGDCY